jgi:putative aldouronate transport system permease protein
MTASSKSMASADERWFNVVLYALTFLILVIVLYPLLFVLSASFSDPTAILLGEVWLWPKGFHFEGYLRVFENAEVWTGYRNTLIYTSFGTLINILLTVLAAYPLSRRDLPGRNALMLLIAITMFFNGGLIPTYLLVKNIGIVDTIWAMLIPNAIATYNLIIMRTFFQNGIPYELQESAWVDGCSNFRMLLTIVLPLSKPILAVMLLFYGVSHWNAFFQALIYLRDSELFPLQLILRQILIMNQSDQMGIEGVGHDERLLISESIKYALIIVSSIPVLLIYPFVQKYFVQGVMIGAIKG